MKVFENGKDVGYLDDQNWWANPDNPNRYRIANLDEDYPDEYFANDHVKRETVLALCDYVKEYYQKIRQKKLYSVIEYGCGGGWFLQEFQKRGVQCFGVDGSIAAIKSCQHRGIKSGMQQMDLRKQWPSYRYDVALCTEVAEHIEPIFSGFLIRNITNHSEVVWWSSEEPNTNRPHLHHPNEQPYEFWINLFDFYGFGCYRLPDDVFDACEGRGRMIFYNRTTIKI